MQARIDGNAQWRRDAEDSDHRDGCGELLIAGALG